MIEHHDAGSSTSRERALEVEIARLNAEIEERKGADPGAATSRFLTMAAATVDQAVADARTEADEMAAEIRSQAEARRDEATRLATEAEATAERFYAEVGKSRELVVVARAEAEEIRETARSEAGQLVAVERERVADEMTALSELREALQDERGALEGYHDELKHRVQDLAESMVAFMTTEPPTVTTAAIEKLASAGAHPREILNRELVAVLGADETSIEEALADEAVIDETVEDEVVAEPQRDAAPVVGDFGGVPVVDTPVGYDPFERAAGGRVPDLYDLQPVPETVDRAPGLFERATEEETVKPQRSGSLFGAHGSRLVGQGSSEKLADALADDDATDDAFDQFLSGDDAPDPSRDWLLRPEQS